MSVIRIRGWVSNVQNCWGVGGRAVGGLVEQLGCHSSSSWGISEGWPAGGLALLSAGLLGVDGRGHRRPWCADSGWYKHVACFRKRELWVVSPLKPQPDVPGPSFRLEEPIISACTMLSAALLSLGTATHLALPRAHFDDTATYSAVATNGHGQVSTQAAVVVKRECPATHWGLRWE